MTRLYLLGGAAVAFAAVLAALWWQVDRNARLQARFDACQQSISTSEDFNDAASNPSGRSWLERLGGMLPDTTD